MTICGCKDPGGSVFGGHWGLSRSACHSTWWTDGETGFGGTKLSLFTCCCFTVHLTLGLFNSFQCHSDLSDRTPRWT